jgi:hypothetical protein
MMSRTGQIAAQTGAFKEPTGRELEMVDNQEDALKFVGLTAQMYNADGSKQNGVFSPSL